MKQHAGSILFGLILGLVAGFIYTARFYNAPPANIAGQTAATGAPQGGSQSLPPGHPPLPAEIDIAPLLQHAKSNPKDFKAQFDAAEALYQSGRFEEAAEYYKKAHGLAPNQEMTYTVIVSLGNVYFDAAHAANDDTERYKQAEEWYRKALEINPKDTNVRTDLGITYFYRNPPEIDKAIAEYQKVLELNPQHPQALQNMTVAMLKKGDIKGADEMITRLSAIAPGNPVVAQLREDINRMKSGQPLSQ